MMKRRPGESPQDAGRRFELPNFKSRGAEWAAGLFDGEGSINSDFRAEGRNGLTCDRYYTRFAISMTDEKEIRDFQEIVGIGNVTTHASRPGCKQMWYWQVSRVKDLFHVAKVIGPWLSDRRREQISQCFSLDLRIDLYA